MMRLSGPVGIKDVLFGSRIKDFIPVSLDYARNWALFCSFPDQEVRRMAVQWIGSLSDAELLDYLPQLVQVSELAGPLVLTTPLPGPHIGLHCASENPELGQWLV